MSKTLSIVKNYVDTHDGAIVAFTNANRTLTGSSVKEIKMYFKLPVDDDGTGTPTPESVDEVTPVIATILGTDEPILSLSYDMYNVTVTDEKGELGHNLTLNVTVPNHETEPVVNILGDSELQVDHSTEYVAIKGRGFSGTAKGEVYFSSVIYDISYEELPSDKPTTSPKPLTGTDSVSYKLVDSMVVHIGDSDTVNFIGDDNSNILYGNGRVRLINVSELALQHLAKYQRVELFTTNGDYSGVVYTGYISEVISSGNTVFIYLLDELPDNDRAEEPRIDNPHRPWEQAIREDIMDRGEDPDDYVIQRSRNTPKCPKGEPGVEGGKTSPIEENGVPTGDGTIQGKTIQLGNTSITTGDKTMRITADKITLEGVTIVQEPHNEGKTAVLGTSGTNILEEFLKGLEIK